jgi:hypothetical protein
MTAAVDAIRALRAHTVNEMERQAGLGRSLEDVLEAVPPIEPTDPAPTHALFGIAPEDAPEDAPAAPSTPVANGLAAEPADSKKKKKKKKKKSDRDKKKKKKKKKKSGKGGKPGK